MIFFILKYIYTLTLIIKLHSESFIFLSAASSKGWVVVVEQWFSAQAAC